jgi:hypothetical protein
MLQRVAMEPRLPCSPYLFAISSVSTLLILFISVGSTVYMFGGTGFPAGVICSAPESSITDSNLYTNQLADLYKIDFGTQHLAPECLRGIK